MTTEKITEKGKENAKKDNDAKMRKKREWQNEKNENRKITENKKWKKYIKTGKKWQAGKNDCMREWQKRIKEWR